MKSMLPTLCVVAFAGLVSCSPEPAPTPANTTPTAATPAAAASAPAPSSNPTVAPVATPEPACLVRSGAIGPLRVGMSLDQVRQAAPRVELSRTSDGEGVALVDVSLDGASLAIAYAGEDDAARPVDMARVIEYLETFNADCATAEGIHPGSTVEAAVAAYGPVRIIGRSEIESRESIEFERQPPGLHFRLDYAGEFAEGESETTRYAPGAKLLSIAVSRP